MTNWGGVTPRAWQADALPKALAAIRAGERGIVRAIMGSGKSVMIAQVCASGRGRVLVTVPTMALVDQLAATIERRCPGEVGRYYTHAKQAGERITIACMDSLPRLAVDPAWPGPPALWICDEAHKSESNTVLEANSAIQPLRAIGFTATPFRSKRTEELSLWTSIVYDYGVKEAMRDKVLVPYRLVHWQGGEATTDQACLQMIADLGMGHGLVNAANIEDAEAFARTLTGRGIPAQAVHSRRHPERNKATLEQLRTGALRCIVHVNMLSEGIDLPWLRWLCLRRPVGSKVRFCQEVGRVLRSAPGKTEAVLLDPMDLFNGFGLTYEAVLAGGAAPVGEPPEFGDAEADAIEAARQEPDGIRMAKQLAAWRAYLRRLYHGALVAGVIEQKIRGTSWRYEAPSPKQLDNVRHAVSGLSRDLFTPPRHRKLLAEIADHAIDMRRGDVSDLMTVCFALRDGRRSGESVWQRIAAATKDTGEVDA